MMFHDFSGLLLKKCFKCKCDFSVCLLGLHYSERQTNTLLDLLFLNNGLTHSLRNQPHWKVFLLFFFFFFPLNCELQSKAVLIESSSGVLKKYLDKDSLHHIWKKIAEVLGVLVVVYSTLCMCFGNWTLITDVLNV